MPGLYRGFKPQLITALVCAWLFTMVYPSPSQAGDPEDIIGPTDLLLYECIDRNPEAAEPDPDADKGTGTGTTTQSSNEDDFDILDIEKIVMDIIDRSVGNYAQDLFDLIDACENLGGKLEKIHRTQIEGYVYEFHPVDPENPATSEWFAVPSRDVPVIAEGVTFEIFWGSERDGFFYFYKTRFGQGPIVLNLRLPEDAHQINPNILIESTGLDETWTVFLGFYRGDVPPPNIDQLKTPDGNFLPFGNTKFNSIVGLDGKSALPGVGGVRPQEPSNAVIALAVLIFVALPALGLVKLRQERPY